MAAEVSEDLAGLTAVTRVTSWVDVEGQDSVPHLDLITMRQYTRIRLGFRLEVRDQIFIIKMGEGAYTVFQR